MLNTTLEKNRKFIVDIRAEKLFREAEDDFFYFGKINDAIEKLEKALMFSPQMIKALLMRANIDVIEGALESALGFYLLAETYSPDNVKVLAGLANIYEMKGQNDKALEYIEKAFDVGFSKFSPLNKVLIDLKFTVLVKQKKYLEAQRIIEKSKYVLSENDFREIQLSNLSILKQKISLQKRLEKTNLKLVK